MKTLLKYWFIITHWRDYKDIMLCHIGRHRWQQMRFQKEVTPFDAVQKCTICLKTRVWWDDNRGWVMHELPGSNVILTKENML